MLDTHDCSLSNLGGSLDFFSLFSSLILLFSRAFSFLCCFSLIFLFLFWAAIFILYTSLLVSILCVAFLGLVNVFGVARPGALVPV